MPRRGLKRKLPTNDDANLENHEENGAGKEKSTPSIIDFEEIIRASNIIPNTGCGGNQNNDKDANLNLHKIPQDLQSADALPTGQVNPSQTKSNDQISAIRLANDDLTAHIPSSIKQQICRGEYINLALLLKGAVDLAEFCSGSFLKISADGRIESSQRECKDKINTIEKWTDAFIVYSSIYLASHPGKTHELLHYMYNIRECAKYQGGEAWKVYDEQFRLRQALNPSPWSQINNDLWWRCMQVRHSNNGPQTKPATQSFMYSCKDFNTGVCRWPNCKFSHACSKCGGPHALINCGNSNLRLPPFATQSTATAPFKAKDRPFHQSSNFRGRGRGFSRGGRQ